jgi:hypothetical protein
MHHSARETQHTPQRVLLRATALTTSPLLVRLDSGLDSHALIGEVCKPSAARIADGEAAIDVLVKGTRSDRPRRRSSGPWNAAT